MSCRRRANRSRRRSTRRPWPQRSHRRRRPRARVVSAEATVGVATAEAAGEDRGMNGPIKVAVAGHRGKVGSILAAALAAEPDIEYVGGIARGDDLAAFLHAKRPPAFVEFTRPPEPM